MAFAQPPPNKPPAPSTGLTFALQALLSRHESYIASSEAERTALTAQVLRLESDKCTLERKNADIVRENRELLDHLEALNNTVTDSDAHIASLAATLAEAQYEVKRLAGLATRAEELERQLEEMEVGRMVLEKEAKEKEENERSAVWRWKEAEGRVRSMNEQVERIEREASSERERHAELVARMERRRVVERELELERAAGRLKGAAAVVKREGDGGGGKQVVSHFVRDILQDNANLQAGIVELRDLLQGSNEEVENLRELVMVHQPVSNSTTGAAEDGDEACQTTPLNEVLDWVAAPKQAPQEVHVHHHYHASFSTKKDKTPLTRRGSKKRAAIGLLTPTPGSPRMQTPSPRRASLQSPPLGALSQSLPYSVARKPRWSVQSTTTGSSTMSSLPNSPRSYFDHRNSSVFDRIESLSETSRPTSPESDGYATPQFELAHQKGKVSDFSLSAFAELSDDARSSARPSARRALRPPDDDTPLAVPLEKGDRGGMSTVEEDDIDPLDISTATGSAPEAGTEKDRSHCNRPIQEARLKSPLELSGLDQEPQHGQTLMQPNIRRSTSHESLVSISGMDIHIPKNSSSQIFALGRGSSSTSVLPSRALPSSRPLASIVEVNANSSNVRSASGSASASSMSMLSSLAASRSSSSPQTSANADGEWQGGLGRLVGGWVRGRWGIAPMASTGNLRAQANVSPSTTTNPFSWRSPGINQTGAISGLRPPVRTPSEVHARVVNEGLLKESLAE